MSALLLVTVSGLFADGGGERRRQPIWLGPGPFVLYSSCKDPVEGPATTPLPFPRAALDEVMRSELHSLGVPLVAAGVFPDSVKQIDFASCVWRRQDGQYEYHLTLHGPWPQDALGEVEDISYWPRQGGTAPAEDLRSTLVQETRRLARAFMRSVRIGARPK